MNRLRHDFSLRPMNLIATNVPIGTIHAAGNSRKHGLSIHCVFYVKDNTHIAIGLFIKQLNKQKGRVQKNLYSPFLFLCYSSCRAFYFIWVIYISNAL